MSRIFERMGLDPRGAIAGSATAASLVAAIAVGSRGFSDFDPALVHYAFAAVFAAFAVVYRYAVWLGRPPTWRYFVRTLELLRARGAARGLVPLAPLVADGFGAQRFIARRSRLRWVTHLCLSWGSSIAFAVTFPLVFGWLHFETTPVDAERYRAVVFGFVAAEFPVHSVVAFLAFNALNLSAVLVLVGVALALWRRLGEAGEVAVQQFGHDVVPLLLLFAVAATGILLTVSARWLGGNGYPFLALTHAVTVIALLLYLPFGKLFHVFQRPAQLGVALYRQAGAEGAQARCLRCGESFASAMHVADLQTVLAKLGIDQRLPGGGHYQEVCPPCRRRLVALNQGRMLGRLGPDPFAAAEPDLPERLAANGWR